MSTALHQPQKRYIEKRKYRQVSRRKYLLIHQIDASQKEQPHLAPISASITELDQQYPHLAPANRENWKQIGYRPTVPWREFERQRDQQRTTKREGVTL